MSRNGSGTYSLPAGNPVVTGTTISSTWANNTLSDIATAITGSIAADGQTPITGNLAMGGFKLTGLGAGSVAGDSVRYEQFAAPPAIGNTTANSGAFTTLSASSTVSGTGFSTYLASPPAIGGTVAAAGSFTTLSASSTVSGAGFSTYLASPPAIGGTVAAAGNFTTLGASGQITSTVTTGTPPLVVSSTTPVANLSIGGNAATASSILPSGTKGIGILKFGTLNVAQNTTQYMATIGGGTRVNIQAAALVTPIDITVSELRVQLSTAVPASNSAIFTLYVNGIATALTCTVGAGATTASDVTHTVKIPAGSQFAIQSVTSATFGSTNDLKASLVCRDNTNSYGVSPLMFSAYQSSSLSAVFGDNNSTMAQTIAANYLPVPPCQISEYTVGINSATGLTSGTPTGYVVQKNGNNFNTKFYYSNQLPSKDIFIEGDTFVVGTTSAVTASTVYSASFLVEPSTQGYYPPTFMTFGFGSQAQSTTHYAGGYGASTNSAVESDVSVPMPACTVKNLRVTTSASSAGGTTVFTVRKNGVDTGVTCTIGVSQTTASDLTHTVTFAAGDVLSISSVAGAVGTRNYSVTIETGA